MTLLQQKIESYDVLKSFNTKIGRIASQNKNAPLGVSISPNAPATISIANLIGIAQPLRCRKVDSVTLLQHKYKTLSILERQYNTTIIPENRKGLETAISVLKSFGGVNGQHTFKERQFEVIQKINKAQDDVHAWIRSVDDIKTAREAFEADGCRKVYSVTLLQLMPDEEAYLAKINQDVFESVQVHVRSCLSEVRCGIICGS